LGSGLTRLTLDPQPFCHTRLTLDPQPFCHPNCCQGSCQRKFVLTRALKIPLPSCFPCSLCTRDIQSTVLKSKTPPDPVNPLALKMREETWRTQSENLLCIRKGVWLYGSASVAVQWDSFWLCPNNRKNSSFSGIVGFEETGYEDCQLDLCFTTPQSL
jgi:hypothetical protein